VTACDRCLRRGALLRLLVPWIARALDQHRRLPAVLALEDDALLEGICGRKRDVIDAQLAGFDPAAARSEAAAAGLETICRHDDGFPLLLLEGPDAVAALWYLGDPAWLRVLAEERAVALVGARRPSAYGLEVAGGLGRKLAAAGVPVVSGMALGIDSAAHEGALEGGGLTVAVLAGGADFAYPRSRARLHRRIATTGLVVSEFPPGTRPLRWSFPARNRIMAGLATMTVVVEGTVRSGSLITAGFAQDLGRELGAVPGQVTSVLAAGPNGLIADGAHVVRSATDVLDVVYGAGAGPRAGSGAGQPALEPRLAGLLEAVGRGEGSPDMLAADPSEAADVLAGLTELELLGLVRRAAGGRYVRSA
jgi:DNA processing protein